MGAQIDAAWRESVEEEVKGRLAARGLTLEVQQSNGSHRQISTGRKLRPLFLAMRVFLYCLLECFGGP